MWVVSIHGVGDAARGETAQLLIRGLTGGSGLPRQLCIGNRKYPHYRAGRHDFVEVNWSDLQRPWWRVPGLFRHLLGVGVAMLHPAADQWEAAQSPLRTWYGRAMEAYAAWSVYPVLLGMTLQSLSGWADGLVVGALLGLVALLVTVLWHWSQWLRYGGLVCLVALALGTAFFAAGWFEATSFAATTTVVYAASQFLVLVFLITLVGRTIWQLALERKDPRLTLTALAASYLPLVVLSVFGSCVWVLALWAVESLRSRAGFPRAGFDEWATTFLNHLGYDLLLAEWMMALATLGIGILAAFGLYRYWKAIGGNAGAVARTWLGIMLWTMPALLLLTGVALLFSSPLNPAWRRLAGLWGLSVLTIYTVSATRFVSFLPVASQHVRIVLRVMGDVVFYIADPACSLSIRVEAQTRLRELLVYLCKRYPTEKIAVVGHSQGSVIAYDVLLQLAQKGELTETSLVLVTMGSPLRSLYTDFLGRPLSLFPSSTVRWVNLYRSDDYIGGAIDQEPPLDKTGGHCGYWSDGKILDRLTAEFGIDTRDHSIRLDDLWEDCDHCHRTGQTADAVEGRQQICPACNGKGGHPTSSGQAILDFLARGNGR